MTRLICGLVLMVAVGCTGIQPVGPLAKKNGSSTGDPKADKDPGPADPVVIPAPKPTPPACLVRAEDVTSENVEMIKKQLSAEIDADRKSLRNLPVTAEVSQYKDGVNIK
jgi:hypothetical protein